jgi:hypothetical protein
MMGRAGEAARRKVLLSLSDLWGEGLEEMNVAQIGVRDWLRVMTRG